MRRGGRKRLGIAVAAFCATLFAALALLLTQGGEARALADTAPSLGDRDYPIATYSSSERYVSGYQGVEITITCSLATERLSYAFDPNWNDMEGYGGMLEPEGEIPLEVNAAGTALVGKIATSYNGEFIFTAYVNKGGTDVLAAEGSPFVVDKIDWSPPVLDASRESFEVGENGEMFYTIYVTDAVRATNGFTAASGLSEVLIFYWDEATSFPEETLEGLKDIDELTERCEGAIGESLRKKYPTTRLQQADSLSFDVSQTGVAYYVLVIDKVGNVGLHRLFYRNVEGKLELKVNGTTLNVLEAIELAEWEAENYKATYRESLLAAVSEAAFRLRLAFLHEYDDDAKLALWLALGDAQRAIASAKRELTVRLFNEDLLGGKTEVSSALDDVLKRTKYGDEAVLELNWAVYSGEKGDRDAIEAAGLSDPNGIWKLEYRLTLNGEEVAPDAPIKVYVEWDQVYDEIAFSLKKKGGETLKAEGNNYGGSWLELSLTERAGSLWIVTKRGSDLLWLWILLGVAGGAGIALAVALPLVLKKKKRGAERKSAEGAGEEERKE